MLIFHLLQIRPRSVAINWHQSFDGADACLATSTSFLPDRIFFFFAIESKASLLPGTLRSFIAAHITKAVAGTARDLSVGE